MNAWIVTCWATDLPMGEQVSWYPTLEAAIYAALALVVADREVVPALRSVYSVCEADFWQLI